MPSSAPQLLPLGKVTFPEAHYININMMPVITGDPESIPEEYRQYYPMIEACGIEKAEIGKVGYLTITETYVPKGVCQRRPGVHTDGHCCSKSDSRFKPGKNRPKATGQWGSGGWGGPEEDHICRSPRFTPEARAQKAAPITVPDPALAPEPASVTALRDRVSKLEDLYIRLNAELGRASELIDKLSKGGVEVYGERPAEPLDGSVIGYGTLRAQGIYMASSVAKTTRAWDVRIEHGGWMGDCEGCPDIMKMVKKLKPVLFEANRLYWITDRCPHECLPMPRSDMRQFFRYVTSAVDIWYTQHSTPNRLGVKPKGKMLYGSKFNPKKKSHQQAVNGPNIKG